jgi:ferredoxin-NADP reductase
MSSGDDKPLSAPQTQLLFAVRVSGRKWLAEHTFELRFDRPPGFAFLPGQKLKLFHNGIERIYTLTNTSQDHELAICVRHIPHGKMSPVLARAPKGQIFHLSPAFGFFLLQPTRRPAVFVATGTGIAPFVAFARSGARGFDLLHGVRSAEELYYHDLLAACARSFIPCLSRIPASQTQWPRTFCGRVTDYLGKELALADYDIYLCGRGEMVRDAMRIIDRRFPSARVFTETFF